LNSIRLISDTYRSPVSSLLPAINKPVEPMDSHTHPGCLISVSLAATNMLLTTERPARKIKDLNKSHLAQPLPLGKLNGKIIQRKLSLDAKQTSRNRGGVHSCQVSSNEINLPNDINNKSKGGTRFPFSKPLEWPRNRTFRLGPCDRLTFLPIDWQRFRNFGIGKCIRNCQYFLEKYTTISCN